MRHNVGHRKLGRVTEHRLALLRNQAIALLRHERIETTMPKAKELRPFVERLITKAKKDDLHNKRQIFAALPANAARKTIEVLGPRFKDRKGGYTRIVRLGKAKDGMPKVQLELLD